MSKRSSDQQRYSVDDMMDRLKESDREKREQESSQLVTRPDGSQVVRVRRRKRRSKQPVKEQQVRRKRYASVLIVGAVVLLLGLIVTAVVLVARFNSKSFRDELTQRIGTSSGSNVALSDLTVTPVRVRAAGLQMEWSGRGVLKSLLLNDISADLNLGSLFGKDWTGKEALGNSGLMILGRPVEGAPALETSGTFPFLYEQYRCPNFEIRLGTEERTPLRLTNTEMTLRPSEGQMQIILSGGRLVLDGWEELRVHRGIAELRSGSFLLRSLKVVPRNGSGDAMLSSRQPVGDGEMLDFQVELQNFPLKTLLGPELGRLLDGVVQTSTQDPGKIEIHPNQPGTLSVEINFEGVSGVLQDLPFLTKLPILLQESDYKKPSFSTIKGAFRRDKTGTSLSGLVLEQEGKFMITGGIDVTTRNELKGTLLVGVSEKTLANITGHKPWMGAFSDPRSAYRWVEINLSNTLESPEDDLERTLQKAVERYQSGEPRAPSTSLFPE